MERIHLYIEGLVQGVGFRYYTRAKAKEAGVFGWVKNLSDGRVEIVAEGEKESIDKFMALLREGNLGTHIDKAEKDEEPYTGHFRHFYISYNEYRK